MDPNPYEPPQSPGEQPISRTPRRWLCPKPWWGYLVAVIVGGIVIGGLIMPLTAALDDSGGWQMIIGGFLGLVIYGLLF